MSICPTRSVLQDLCKVNLPGSFTELLRKIHAAGFSTRCMSEDPSQNQSFIISIQEPCWSLYRGLVQDPCFRISCRIHDCGPATRSMSQVRTLCKIYVSRSSKRSFPLCERCASPDLCLSILICGPSARSMSQDPLQNPCLRTRYTIHVSGSTSPHLQYVSASLSVGPMCKIHVPGGRICDSARRSMSQDAYLSVHSCGFATG